MKCKKHPYYKAIRKPQCTCEVCWEIYNKKHNSQGVLGEVDKPPDSHSGD